MDLSNPVHDSVHNTDGVTSVHRRVPEKDADASPALDLASRHSKLSEPPDGKTSSISAEQAEAIQRKALEILRKEYPPPCQESPLTQPSMGGGRGEGIPPEVRKPEVDPQPIPARMLNEFVYCQRLFYYEFVEGVFVESADTLRGAAIHQRVDSGTGALPKAKRKSEVAKPKEAEATAAVPADSTSKEPEPLSAEPETIH